MIKAIIYPILGLKKSGDLSWCKLLLINEESMAQRRKMNCLLLTRGTRLLRVNGRARARTSVSCTTPLALPCPLPFTSCLFQQNTKSRRNLELPFFCFPHSTAHQSRLRDHRSLIRWKQDQFQVKGLSPLPSVQHGPYLSLGIFKGGFDLHQHWGTHQLMILTNMVLGWKDLEDFPQTYHPRRSHGWEPVIHQKRRIPGRYFCLRASPSTLPPMSQSTSRASSLSLCHLSSGTSQSFEKMKCPTGLPRWHSG